MGSGDFTPPSALRAERKTLGGTGGVRGILRRLRRRKISR